MISRAFGAAALMLAALPQASAETLCVVGDAYIEMGEIVPPSVIVSRNVRSGADCQDGSVAFIQETDRRVLTSTEIKRLRAKSAEKGIKEHRALADRLGD